MRGILDGTQSKVLDTYYKDYDPDISEKEKHDAATEHACKFFKISA